MDNGLPAKLAAFTGKGYVIAPAGYGKTHLIAMAVKASSKRQLILTHTYAGVHAIKAKMRTLGVSSSLYQIDTLASWSLRLCLCFPQTSKWNKEYPDTKDWVKLYDATTSMFPRPFVKRLIQSSYAGLYVDEYQDCSSHQHKLIDELACLLPCRLLGDPMQAIFDFAEPPVDWVKEVYPHYKLLGELDKPWRWHTAGAIELGNWLDIARTHLHAGDQIPISGALPKGVTRVSVDLADFKNNKRLYVFYPFLENDESVIAIYSGDQKSKNKTHQLAKDLGGKFSSIEEVEGKALFSFIHKLEGTKNASQKLLLVLEFTKKCLSHVGGILSAATKRGEEAKVTKATKYPEVLDSANRYLQDPSSSNLSSLMKAIQENPETLLCRRDLLNRLMIVLRTHQENSETSLLESAQQYQRHFRHSGRPVRHNKLIGTTLLVKGLEYDHAIIIGADSMSPKELYVALTRGAKSITIVSMLNAIPA